MAEGQRSGESGIVPLAKSIILYFGRIRRVTLRKRICRRSVERKGLMVSSGRVVSTQVGMGFWWFGLGFRLIPGTSNCTAIEFLPQQSANQKKPEQSYLRHVTVLELIFQRSYEYCGMFWCMSAHKLEHSAVKVTPKLERNNRTPGCMIMQCEPSTQPTLLHPCL